MWLCAFGCNFGKKMEKINLLKQQEQLDSRHANTTATQIYETAVHIKFKLYMHRKYHKRNINSCKRWIDPLFPPSKGEYTTHIIHKQLHKRRQLKKKKKYVQLHLRFIQPLTSDIRNDNQL